MRLCVEVWLDLGVLCFWIFVGHPGKEERILGTDDVMLMMTDSWVEHE